MSPSFCYHILFQLCHLLYIVSPSFAFCLYCASTFLCHVTILSVSCHHSVTSPFCVTPPYLSVSFTLLCNVTFLGLVTFLYYAPFCVASPFCHTMLPFCIIYLTVLCCLSVTSHLSVSCCLSVSHHLTFLGVFSNFGYCQSHRFTVYVNVCMRSAVCTDITAGGGGGGTTLGGVQLHGELIMTGCPAASLSVCIC